MRTRPVQTFAAIKDGSDALGRQDLLVPVPYRQRLGIRRLPKSQEMTRKDEGGMLAWPTLARAQAWCRQCPALVENGVHTSASTLLLGAASNGDALRGPAHERMHVDHLVRLIRQLGMLCLEMDLRTPLPVSQTCIAVCMLRMSARAKPSLHAAGEAHAFKKQIDCLQ